jgi:DNA-binding XRE family transcriptional regulator
MSNQPLDFTKVESLRRHMLLTTGDMSELLGVTRMTYYGWLKGKPLRAKNEAKVRARLRQLLSIMATHSWPMPEVIASNQKQRKARLLELLEE